MSSQKPRLIALEEHYADPELDAALGVKTRGPAGAALNASVEGRLAAMDAAGIDLQVLSLAPPALQHALSTSEAPALARGANDRLAEMIKQGAGRLAGFATLPTADPAAAADELARCVEVLGLKGAMIHGPTGGLFIDDPSFRPLLKRANDLGVPLYLHPCDPMDAVREAYLAPYDKTHPMFMRAGWGFTIETGTHAMRLALSGAFDDCPDLQIILGHLGEGIPYLMPRIEEALARDTAMKNFGAVFCAHFHVTTSGFFSDAALLCCLQEMGADRIMFSIDWPFASNEAGVEWFKRVTLSPTDRAKIAGGNAARLLKLEN